MANVDRLDQSAIDALEQYVRDGGGVAFFLGERSDSRFINDALYRDGKGLFPLPLAGPAELLVDRLEKTPDIEVDAGHFIFRVFAEKRNSFLDTVLVERYFAAPQGWKPPAGSTDSRAGPAPQRGAVGGRAEFRQGAGGGDSSTTAAPTLEQLGPQPQLRRRHAGLAGLLGRPAGDRRRRGASGEPLEVTFSAAEYQPQVRFVTPDGDAPADATVDAVRRRRPMAGDLRQTDRSGFYEAQLDQDQRQGRDPPLGGQRRSGGGRLAGAVRPRLGRAAAAGGQVPVRPGGDVRVGPGPTGRTQPRRRAALLARRAC